MIASWKLFRVLSESYCDRWYTRFNVIHQFIGSAQVPGPLGIPPTGVGRRVPGPMGRTLWDKQSTSQTQTPVTKNVKKTTMPPPTNDHENKDVHVITTPLYNAKNVPAFTEVKQAPGIANCPVGAILAALAFTSVGQGIIQGMLSETTASVSTDLSGLPADTLTNPPPGTTISSSRYFTVKLPKGTVDVSDVLYTDDHDSGWSPFYMRDPGDQTIWAPIIEKALAAQLGSYENFDALDIKANDFWEKITGVRPGFIEIKPDTPLSTITDAAKASTRVPSIGASKPDRADVKFVSEFHGFALLGYQDSKIRLYDAAKATTIPISPADFRHDFQAILYRK
jgi:hypothetical protein